MDYNQEIKRIAKKRFLLNEDKYKSICKAKAIENILFLNDELPFKFDKEIIKVLAEFHIAEYEHQISAVKRKIKEKVIVETLYPEEMKLKSLERFPPYI